MLLTKNEFKRLDAPFAEKGVDVRDGDIVKITGDIVVQPSRFDVSKNQNIIKVLTKNGERYVGLNQDSVNILIDELHSNNSVDWLGKEVKVLLNKTTIGGKKVIVLYLVGPTWEMDEYGSPINTGVQPEPGEDIPTIQVNDEVDPNAEAQMASDEAKGVNIADVPF